MLKSDPPAPSSTSSVFITMTADVTEWDHLTLFLGWQPAGLLGSGDYNLLHYVCPPLSSEGKGFFLKKENHNKIKKNEPKYNWRPLAEAGLLR